MSSICSCLSSCFKFQNDRRRLHPSPYLDERRGELEKRVKRTNEKGKLGEGPFFQDGALQKESRKVIQQPQVAAECTRF